MLALIKTLVQKSLGIVGFEIKRNHSPCRSLKGGINLLKRITEPDYIIDVGVADGTPELYESFPNAKFILVEANPDYRNDVEKISTKINAKVEQVFCGAEKGSQVLRVYKGKSKSSAFAIVRDIPLEKEIEVPVETLDSIAERHDLNGNIVIKIDVEGAELEVLKGGRKTLESAVAVIAEVSISKKFVGGTNFAEMVCEMDRCGFRVFDILALRDSKDTGFLYQGDVVFIRKGENNA